MKNKSNLPELTAPTDLTELTQVHTSAPVTEINVSTTLARNPAEPTCNPPGGGRWRWDIPSQDWISNEPSE